MRLASVLALLLTAATADAAAAPEENPAVDTRSAQRADTASAAGESGTTIFGERESAMGLYLTPWKNESPGDIDRPPMLLDHPADAIDADAYREQVQTEDMIAAYRRAQMQRRR